MKNFYEYLCEIGHKPFEDKIPQRVAMVDEEDGRLMDWDDFDWYILVSEGFRKSVFIKSITDKQIILVRR